MAYQPEVHIREVSGQRELRLAQSIRHAVFTEEQGISPELDADGRDLSSHHILLYFGAQAVATGRLTRQDEQEGVLARIAVLPEHRGRGLGKRVVHELEALAGRLGMRTVYLLPHRDLEAFYQEIGYRTIEGWTQTVSGHPLIKMSKQLSANPPAG